jgi:DNA-binding response OmpR family regulator
MRVLVAEDDEGLRSVLERGLRESGYAVDAAGDGELALQYLDTYHYEVGILDWRMPKVNGLEVVQRLRRRGSALPILMLTARDTAGDRVMGLDQGADDYLIKQVDRQSVSTGALSYPSGTVAAVAALATVLTLSC